MPFTPSHAVVALPFVGTRIVPAAVAIGAMVPDLPLFVRVGPDYADAYRLTHSALGAVVLDLPLAFAVLVLWRVLIRPLVPALSPRTLRGRWPGEWALGSRVGWRSLGAGGLTAWLLLAVALLIGIASHIVWDLFTHPGRWGSELIPALGRMWGPLGGTQWLQYGSSALGLLVLGVWGVRRLRSRTPIDPPASAPRWLAPVVWVCAAAALVVPAVAGLLAHGVPDRAGIGLALFRWVTQAGLALLLILVVASVVAAVWRRRRVRG
ncbi:DUF4184 family protein [Protaetiibacter mangrovi]|uniref:DUF4184 family protein n=1 Tax=Protaetiibacter mangrovi TaxID=2970926 RepID=A0ABT1ZFB3_9MICO|nr:DUF4184 family protein [Protaetiibacter mangrovi]MCS0499361.1 DUF4184 family protein [Protaetiibacter mangrovi]TPW92470.1 DUF4184 family protein [Schumannella luteola]